MKQRHLTTRRIHLLFEMKSSRKSMNNFKCEICEKCFSSRKCLAKHVIKKLHAIYAIEYLSQNLDWICILETITMKATKNLNVILVENPRLHQKI